MKTNMLWLTASIKQIWYYIVHITSLLKIFISKCTHVDIPFKNQLYEVESKWESGLSFGFTCDPWSSSKAETKVTYAFSIE